MTRGDILINNISRLNTFVLLEKNNEILENYLNVLQSKRKQNIKFNNDFETGPLDILYISLQLMGNNEKITTKQINKFDQKELKYYLDKIGNLSAIRKMSPSIKEVSHFISYIITSLTHGNYIIGINNDIKFDNGLTLKIDWLVNFCSFINISLDNNKYLIHDGLTFCIRICEFPDEKYSKLKDFLKNIKLYEYKIKRKDNKNISLNNIKYLNDVFSNIKEYDFNKLKQINSLLSKDKYVLSIDKIKVVIDSKKRYILNNYYEEQGLDNNLKEYIKDILNCRDSIKKQEKQKKNEIFEILRGLSHAYKSKLDFKDCRTLIEQKDKNLIYNSFLIANFYINYIYDSDNLNQYFNYETLHLDNVRPSIIDYETNEYKEIISLLSRINKNVILENRKINRCLEYSRHIPKNDNELRRQNSQYLASACHKLEIYSKQIKIERERLSNAKKDSMSKSNVNYTKIKYLKEAVFFDNISYANNKILFLCINSKDFHKTFSLEISNDLFEESILSDINKNLRIEFYTI